MFNNRWWLRLTVLLCAALFLVGLARLFWLRFDAGDLYPLYSSLRSDPLGTQVFFESLNNLGELGAERNFKAFGQVSIDSRTTFFVCGLFADSTASGNRQWQPLIDAVAANGGRIVFAFKSTTGDGNRQGNGDAASNSGAPKDDGKVISTDDGRVAEDKGAASGLWGLGLELSRGNSRDGPSESDALQSPQGSGHLPETLIWHSRLFFDLFDPAWETIFTFEKNPVVARRSWGAGELVMVADSFQFSNEALRDHRSPGFLAWVVQPTHRVIFDEVHHGLSRQPGIAALVRKYRLHGVALSLLVLAVLLIWRQAAVFVPGAPDAENAEQETAFGHDAAEGWVSLMQQHIAPADLLSVCHQAWASSSAADRVPEDRAQRVRDLVARYGGATPRQNLVAVYRSICELLIQGKNS